MSAHNSVESDQCPGEHGTAVSSVEQEQSRQQAKLNMDYTHCNYLPPRKWNIRSIQVAINVIKHHTQSGARYPAWLQVTMLE